MRKISFVVSLLLILVLLLTGCGSSATAPTGKLPAGFTAAKVVRTVDGDTIVVNINGKEEKVRLIGANTPETVHPDKPVEYYGKEASNYTKSILTAGKTVYLEVDAGDTDKYGRLLRYLWLEVPNTINDAEIRAKMFNAKLLLDGYAQTMTIPPNVKYAEKFKDYQAEARKQNRGLWKP